VISEVGINVETDTEEGSGEGSNDGISVEYWF
jgi:hypothetical protein